MKHLSRYQSVVRSIERGRYFIREGVNVGFEAVPTIDDQTLTGLAQIERVLDLVTPSSRDQVLELGAGTGQQTHIISKLCAQVTAFEINQSLFQIAQDRLYSDIAKDRIRLVQGDGLSLPTDWHGRFDLMIVSFAVPNLSELPLHVLRNDGVGIAPVGAVQDQELVRFQVNSDGISALSFGKCQFVPATRNASSRRPRDEQSVSLRDQSRITALPGLVASRAYLDSL